MPLKSSGPGRQSGSKIDREGISRVVAEARKAQAEREKTYREQSLKIHPWICARCGREFTNKNLHLLTVHHKDHDHDNISRACLSRSKAIDIFHSLKECITEYSLTWWFSSTSAS
ncbi:MAG: hypothetical protein JRF21_11350 [Deltaproteobacteria bacterium]|nr:hypothetical protein [Deltaproteobacteria bacterium]